CSGASAFSLRRPGARRRGDSPARWGAPESPRRRGGSARSAPSGLWEDRDGRGPRVVRMWTSIDSVVGRTGVPPGDATPPKKHDAGPGGPASVMIQDSTRLRLSPVDRVTVVMPVRRSTLH